MKNKIKIGVNLNRLKLTSPHVDTISQSSFKDKYETFVDISNGGGDAPFKLVGELQKHGHDWSNINSRVSVIVPNDFIRLFYKNMLNKKFGDKSDADNKNIWSGIALKESELI